MVIAEAHDGVGHRLADIVALGDGLDVVLALVIDDLQQRFFVERLAAAQDRARDFEGMVGKIAHQADGRVWRVSEEA